MYITLILAVLFTAIVVFFSQEFINMFKKIFAIPGAKLILPLMLASWLVEYFEDWLLWILLGIKNALHQVVYWLNALIPFERGSISIAHTILLFLLASLPVWILIAVVKYKGKYDPWPYTYELGAILWLTAAILLTVHWP